MDRITTAIECCIALAKMQCSKYGLKTFAFILIQHTGILTVLLLFLLLLTLPSLLL